MAVVNFLASSSVLRGALNDLFNDTDVISYSILLLNDGSPISGALETCDFKAALYSSANGVAYVSLEDPVYFVIDSGTTVDGIALTGTLAGDITKVFIGNEAVTTKTYSDDGTYTVSDLVIELGA